jgi:cytochrome c-type biogenesis protein CcmF
MNNSTLGEFSILIALVFCIWGFVNSALGGSRRDSKLAEVGRRAAIPTFLFATFALVVLEVALLTNDTSVNYVANHSASTSPLWVKIVSLWGALAGSILLWAWLLAGFLLLVSRIAKNDALRPYALATMFAVLTFFLGVNATVGSPFLEVPFPPTDGTGPNALLQNHWMMAVHPVLMYIGFVGLSVPFAYAIAAMLTGRLGETWLVQTRRWSIVAWTFLSAAIVAGGWWSYEVLGWGGYWAWDPVENASILPWFFTTAYLHSLQIQERRRILKGWNLGLIVAAFSSTVFGTFLTRSGIVQSVHSFSKSPIGPVFLAFFAIVLAVTLYIAYKRLASVRDDHSLDSPLSREGAFLAGNLLFSSFAFTVVLGTMFPVFYEAFTSKTTSVGAPFFNQVGIPIGLAILGLMAVGPALTWRRLEGVALARTLRIPLILALISSISAFALGIHDLNVLLTIAFSSLAIGVILTVTGSAMRQRQKIEGGSSLKALSDLLNAYPRRYGAYITHLGVVVIALGIAFSGAYKVERELAFKPGQSRTVLGHEVQYFNLVGDQRPEKTIQAAKITVDGAEYFPAQNYYGTAREAVSTPAIQYKIGGDFYMVLVNGDPKDQSVSLKFISSPLVSWIWVGGLILVIGAALTLIPAIVSEPKTVSASLPAASD